MAIEGSHTLGFTHQSWADQLSLSRGFLRLATGLTWMLVIGAAVPGVSSAADQWQVGPSVNYSTGRYGLSSRTDVVSAPLTIRRLFTDGDITLNVSYLSISGDCSVTFVSGQPQRTSGRCPTRRALVLPGGGGISRPVVVRQREDGFGDTILRGRYYVLDGAVNSVVPTIAITGRIKFPTADEDRGLGTGKFDEGVGMELSKFLTESWLLFVDGSYTFIGDPEGVNFHDQWNYDVGMGYYLTPRVIGSFYYEEWGALLPGLPNPRDLLVTLSWKMTDTWRMTGSFQLGLSSGAPANGMSFGVSARF